MPTIKNPNPNPPVAGQQLPQPAFGQISAIVDTAATPAVSGTSTGQPITASSPGAAETYPIGVSGSAPAGYGVYGHSVSQAGVQGESQNADAVSGLSHAKAHAGVAGHNDGGGIGVWASGSPAGSFVGDVNVTGTIAAGGDLSATGALTVNGDASVKGTITVGTDIVFSSGADFAEDFELTSGSVVEPGTVMTLGEAGGLEPSQHAYDRKVAGVISGAGDYKPGLILDRRSTTDGRGTLALVGKVFCKVDAAYGGIRPGDMLTTSPTPGHAMRADDPARAFGCVIGKSLGACESGRGLVPILVALQ